MITAYPLLREAEQAFAEARYEEAARLILPHMRAHPTDLRGLALLGATAMKMGAFVQAEGFLRQAIARGNDNPEVRRNLASCLNSQARLGEALELFEMLLNENPDDPDTRSTIALILDKLGRHDEACAVLERLLEDHPKQPPYWISYGHNLRATGRTDEAIKAYRRAIETNVECGEAWWGIGNIKKDIFSDQDIASMEGALQVAVDVRNVAPLHFALARAWHERRQYDKAFQHYSEANRLWAETLNYEADQLTDEVSETARLFSKSYVQSAPAGGDPSTAPVFIISMPRSGSTLLEQMLGSHPSIEPLGELPHIPAMLHSLMEVATRRRSVSVTEAILQLSPDDRAAFGREYLRRAAIHRRTDARHFVDKMPHNWSNVLFIHQILPNARIIDIRRDPMACCFSNFTHSFTRAHSSSFALGDIARAYADYVRLMDHVDQVAPELIHHVRYEELVEAPERELRRIMDYLGLPWDEAVLRFHESKRTVRTPSAEQVRRPLNREGIGTWEPYAEWLGPLREALGPLADA
jgi:tetratricopeptide (TPR) repeat protein